MNVYILELQKCLLTWEDAQCIGLVDNQRTNITLQNNNLANNQSDEKSQKDNLIKRSKAPSKYSRSNKDKDEEEREGKEEDDQEKEKKEERGDKQGDTKEDENKGEKTIDNKSPGINNLPIKYQDQ